MQHSRHNKGRRLRRVGTPLSSIQHTKHAASEESRRQHLKKIHIKRRLARKQTRPDEPATAAQSPARKPRRVRSNPALVKAIRERWAAIAEETQRIVLGDGKYVEEHHDSSVVSSAFAELSLDGAVIAGPSTSSPVRIEHDVFAQIQLSRQGTIFYPHYSPTLARWDATEQRPSLPSHRQTHIDFVSKSTLTSARQLHQLHGDKIGVLSFASPKKPGGGTLHGGDEQEETLARYSSLVASLTTPAAAEFYKEHKKHWAEDGSGLHDHSIVYSPGVVVLRADADDAEDGTEDFVGGKFITPYEIDVVSAVPVNAAAVRAKHIILPSEEQLFEEGIRSAMKERMARVLRIFEEKGEKSVVLGAFGCGSSQNRVEVVASIWAELLVCGDVSEGVKRDARFKNVFDRVVFAVPGKLHYPFRRAFEMRVFEEELNVVASDNESSD